MKTKVLVSFPANAAKDEPVNQQVTRPSKCQKVMHCSSNQSKPSTITKVEKQPNLNGKCQEAINAKLDETKPKTRSVLLLTLWGRKATTCDCGFRDVIDRVGGSRIVKCLGQEATAVLRVNALLTTFHPYSYVMNYST